MKIPKQPAIYEINTAVFLANLSRKYERRITLDTVPDEIWDEIARLYIDAVWFMGVWERSQLAHGMAIENPAFREFLPDITESDILGSAYSIARYSVSLTFGGPEGLQKARQALAERGIGLILDYVPNHVGLDHHWTSERHDYFIQGSQEDLEREPESFFQTPIGIVAKGRDPNFPPWSDVAQLNAYSPALREEVASTLRSIAEQCDGVRCDMAMLIMNDIFGYTWKERAGERPSEEYWQEIIPKVREVNHDFLFIAEAYWDTEKILIDQGFDYCYDKKLYDHLMSLDASAVAKHITETAWFQEHLIRFLDNHDENPPRSKMSFQEERAAMVALSTLNSASMYFDGQIIGYPEHIPVHISRGPEYPVDDATVTFYKQLLKTTQRLRPDINSWRYNNVTSSWYSKKPSRLLSWSWRHEQKLYTVIINFGQYKSSARIRVSNPVRSPLTKVMKSSASLKVSKLNDTTLSATLPAWGYVIVASE